MDNETKKQWYRSGWDDGSENESILRFRLRPDEEREVIFLSEEPIGVWQHSVYYNGRWRVYTCRDALGRCPLCEAGNKRFFVRIFPVIDITGFVGRDGTRRGVGRLYLFPARKNTSSKLRRLFSRESLPEGKLRKYRISRSEGRQVPSVGDNFEFVEFVNAEEYKEFLTPEWQDKILKTLEPLSEENLREIIGSSLEGPHPPAPDGENEDDKPF